MICRFILFFSIVCICFSCKEDKNILEVDLKGKWSVHKALRNDKVTKTLEGGVFTFEADNSFRTNIFGQEKLFKFEKNNGYLKTIEGDPEMNLKLNTTHMDSISLSGKIKYFKLEFFLVRDSIQ